MLSNPPKGSGLVRIIMGLAIMAILLAGYLDVYANGSHPGAEEVFSDMEGVFPFRVLMVPMVGMGHISVFLNAEGTESSPSDIKIWIVSRSPTGESYGQRPILASPSFGSPGWYGANLPLNESGKWEFSIEIIDGELRTVNKFFVEIRADSGFNGPIVIAIIIFGIIALWSIISRLREKNSARIGEER
jgi:hypothetical protein